MSLFSDTICINNRRIPVAIKRNTWETIVEPVSRYQSRDAATRQSHTRCLKTMDNQAVESVLRIFLPIIPELVRES